MTTGKNLLRLACWLFICFHLCSNAVLFLIFVVLASLYGICFATDDMVLCGSPSIGSSLTIQKQASESLSLSSPCTFFHSNKVLVSVVDTVTADSCLAAMMERQLVQNFFKLLQFSLISVLILFSQQLYVALVWNLLYLQIWFCEV